MNTVSQPEIIGLDVSRDWLDLHCVSDGHQLRLRNTDEGHSELAKIAGGREPWFASRPRAVTNGVFGRAWRRRGSKRGSSLRHKSRRSGEAGALWPRRSASFWIGASRLRPIRRGSRGRGSWSRTRAISRTRSGTARTCPDAGCSGRSRSSATRAAKPR